MRMGRKRIRDKHLPTGVTYEHGAYYYRGRDRKRVHLGRAFGEAMAAWSKIVQPEPGSIRTMHDAFERFRIEVVPRKAAATQRGYLYMLPRVDKMFGKMRPGDVLPRHGYQLLAAFAHQPTQALKYFNLISAVLTSCVRWGVIKRNPFREVDKRDYTPRPRDRYPTDAEYAAVRAMASERLQIAMDLVLLTGLRRSALLRLELDDITDEGLRCRRPGKTARPLLFAWTPELREVVERARRLEPRVRRALLCTGPGKHPRHKSGQFYTPDGFQALWGRLMRRAVAAGVIAEPFRLHDIRAKNATDAETIQEAQERLGHTTPATTRRVYIRKPTTVRPLR
jgi:integrase